MDTTRYIAAIEIGSSKISGAVGRTREGGMVDILAVESEKTNECVRYGVIQNLEEAMIRIRSVIDKLERKPEVGSRKITGVYVALGGRSLRSISTQVEHHFSEETEISETILDMLREKALDTTVDASLEVVDAVPRTFKIDKIETITPKGTLGKDIYGVYDIIVCRPDLRRNLNRTLPEKLGIRNEGFVVTAMATGRLLLTPKERHLGCMLVDMGAETTTVSIYKSGQLRFFATLPLGGRNITRDLTSLGLLEEHAEEIKHTSGNALNTGTGSSINLNGLKYSDVNNIVVARAEEIVTNIRETIEYAGLLENDLPGGIVCIGEAVKLNGMTQLISSKTSLNVRLAQMPSFIRLEDMRVPSLDCIQLACCLYEGSKLNDAVCLEAAQRISVPRIGDYDYDNGGNGNGDNSDNGNDNNGISDNEENQKSSSYRRFLRKAKRKIADYFIDDDKGDTELD